MYILLVVLFFFIVLLISLTSEKIKHPAYRRYKPSKNCEECGSTGIIKTAGSKILPGYGSIPCICTKKIYR